MALALYRKYRPATFAEVVGQEHVTEPLRTALAAGRINHAYLFSGPRGCGKTSSARILARSLNCENGPTPDPCGRCGSCVALAPEGPGSLDVVELDAASHGGVNDTRELRDRAFYMPAESRYRVFIIDEAHMVTKEGFNALLKIVEEPPEHLVFVFATTEPDKVLPTIRSRTHHYPFRLLPPATLRALLEKLCGEEGVAVEPAVYPLVVKAGAGSARDALSVMDQLLAGAGEQGVSYADAVALLGVTDGALIDELVDALAASDGAGVFGAVDRVVEAGHDPRRFGADLLQRLRDLVIIQAVPDAVDKGLLDAPADELTAMAGQADRIPTATLTRFAEILHEGLSAMRGTTSPRLVLELLCARMLLPAASADDAGFLQRLERMERRMDIAADHEPAGGGVSAATQRAGISSYDASAVGSAPGARSEDPSPGSGRAAAGGELAAGRGAATGEGVAAGPGPGRGAAASGAAGGARSGTAGAAGPEAAVGARSGAATGEGTAAGPDGTAGNRAAGPDLGLPTPPVLSGARPREDPGPEPDPGAAPGPGPEDAEPAPSEPGAGPSGGRRVSGRGEPAEARGSAEGAQGPADEPRNPAEGAQGRPDTSITVADVRRLWPEIMAAVKTQNRTAHALVESAAVTAVSVTEGTLQLSTRFAALARMISEPRNSELLRSALRSVLGVDWRIRCAEDDGAAAARQEVPAPERRPAAQSAGPADDSVAAGGAGTPDAESDPARHAEPASRAEAPRRRAGAGAESPPAGATGGRAAEPDPDDDPYQGIDPDNDVLDTVEVVDPSAAAIGLLTAKLGARPIDE